MKIQEVKVLTELVMRGDHINVYMDSYKLAYGGTEIAAETVRGLKDSLAISEVRPGNLDLTDRGRVLLQYELNPLKA